LDTRPPAPLRIAIGQLQMHWSGEANTHAIVAAIARAAVAGAQLAVFPELAVTGFHRQIRALAVPPQVEGWLAAIRGACATHALATLVGTPTFGVDGRVFNSALLIGADGADVGVVHKIGLTPAEATFFAAGHDRPVFTLLGRRCSALLCREIDDLDAVAAQLPPGHVDLLLWPGAMRPAVDGSETDPDAHVKRAQGLAQRCGTYIVQANWPNSLNYPDESREAGHSVVVAPDGALHLRLPMAHPGIGVFTLGEQRFDWLPQPA